MASSESMTTRGTPIDQVETFSLRMRAQGAAKEKRNTAAMLEVCDSGLTNVQHSIEVSRAFRLGPNFPPQMKQCGTNSCAAS
jgi:hypothetical protein